MGSTSATQVKRRRVFYIPGYDPFPARRYRELYRKEGAAQAAISGYQLDMLGSAAGERFGWRVRGDIDEQSTEAEIEVLVWSDIVQQSFHASITRTYLAMLRTAWIYISTGALWRLMQLRKGPVIAALYPVVMLTWQFVFAVALGWGVGRIVQVVLAMTPMGPGFQIVLAAVVAALAFGGCLRVFQMIDGKVYAYYLMHDFAHSASRRGAYPAEIHARLQHFGTAIEAALAEEVDEVLVVGHSSGAHLAVTVLADLLRRGAVSGDGPALGFLSLGHVVPMISFLPDAGDMRRDLRFLSTQVTIPWVDVTAPGDGCSFALCDPVAVSGQETPEKRWPLVFSAAFTQSLSPARWQALRWRFFRLHFQYLCAFDRPKDYDYFQITAGPLTLGARYAGRAASASRITRAVSKYTSI
ncbi:hypothetical protein [uncultured Roseobacter sp.]|uniref:hypothetical protein n=1 Tax=uncultured Roseobacter sp. TaxID=114847 RepID=UPI002620123E|nr:hypothetical protein [uncultured Roseobacter sp.]